jgi:hypothetical protein
MVHVCNTMWKIKNQPSNSTSCSDNALLLLVLMVGKLTYTEDFKWCLHFRFGVAFCRVVLREVYFEGPNRIWRALKTSTSNTGNPSRATCCCFRSSQPQVALPTNREATRICICSLLLGGTLAAIYFSLALTFVCKSIYRSSIDIFSQCEASLLPTT